MGDSTAELASEFTFTFEEKEITLVPSVNEERRIVLKEIRIRKRIPDDAGFKAITVPPGENGKPGEIHIEGTDAVEKELTEDLQFLESLLSLYRVNKIEWESAERSFIPENASEKANLGIYSTRQGYRYPKFYRTLKTDLLTKDVARFRDLTIPLAFFREGMRSFDQFNYIASFQSFYFVIEGFYAKGEYRNQEDIFLSDQELMNFAISAYPQIETVNGLQPFYDFYKLNASPESFLRLAVKVRHRLHHYFHAEGDEKYFGNPLTQDYYKPVSLGLWLLCVHVLFGKIGTLRRMDT